MTSRNQEGEREKGNGCASCARSGVIRRLGATQGVDGISSTVRGGRYFIYRPPPGSPRRGVPAAPCGEPSRPPCWRPPVGQTGLPASGVASVSVNGGERRVPRRRRVAMAQRTLRAGCSERAHSQPTEIVPAPAMSVAADGQRPCCRCRRRHVLVPPFMVLKRTLCFGATA